MFFFLKHDFDLLNAEIENVLRQISKIGQEMGMSCQEGAETFHDNFAYEDGERKQLALSHALKELIRIRNGAKIVEPNIGNEVVSIGKTIVIEEVATKKQKTIVIGSFRICGPEQEGKISYSAPLARMLIGAKKGETRESVIGGRKRKYKVISIS